MKDTMITETIRLPESLKLGHHSIDTQHELLYVLYKELSFSIDSSDNNFDLAYVFAGLNTYVKTHFLFEKNLMNASHYKEIDHHLEEHKDLTNKTIALNKLFSSTDSDAEQLKIAQATKEFLIEWLTDHIGREDRKFCQYLATTV